MGVRSGQVPNPVTKPMATDSVIRLATAADAPGIARVHVAVWQTTYRDLLPQAYIDARGYEQRLGLWQRNLGGLHRGLIYVADVHDMVIGFAAAGPARDPSLRCAGELYALYLLAERQRQGIGRRLFITARTALKKKGYPTMMLWVLAGNPACHFYRHLGGQPLARRSEAFGGKALEEIAYGWAAA